ncbi:PREDICTED: blue copper protein [Camelina sativa]|uniref:Blue copper protein n=1 Tax=Camelina sativa TaxID=90675 RepID=A0ABM0WXB8_CAMSA|nr:PREDICTED: blue copper protein [Camelina sativa]
MSTLLGCLALLGLFFNMVAPASSATLTVNWSLGTDYTPLTTGKSFAVGDTIVFTYGAGHTVDEVSENDYKSCTLGNSITSDSSGTTTISLTTTGPRYFICGIPGHCAGGMKLAITVASTTSNGVGGGTTTPTPTPTSFTGGGGYNPTTTQAIPCAGWAVSSPLGALVATWAVVFYALALP